MKIYQNYYFREENNKRIIPELSNNIVQPEYISETVQALMEMALEITENHYTSEGAENA